LGLFFLKNKISSPSASTPLGESFPECAISGSRGRRLPREALSRTLFPESCTRGRLPRVQPVLPRVHLAPGEDPVSRSASWLVAILYLAWALPLGHMDVPGSEDSADKRDGPSRRVKHRSARVPYHRTIPCTIYEHFKLTLYLQEVFHQTQYNIHVYMPRL
jgi:hypothetical protein